MNNRDRHYFANTNFMEKIITKPDFEEFPNRSFGESRKLQRNSTIVSKYMEVEKGSSTNGKKPKQDKPFKIL